MKKKITLLASVIILLTTTLNATVWRVNNRAETDPDFSTLQAAIDGAADSDTLYIEGSPNAYGDGTFTKKLTVYGTGYWLEENDTTQALKNNSEVGKLIFDDGSQGSKVQGLYIYYTDASAFNTIEINTDNIVVERNYIYARNTSTSSGVVYGNAIYVGVNTTNIEITGNWIDARVHHNSYSYSGVTAIGIHIAGIPENTFIKSNLIRAYRSSVFGRFYAIYFATNNSDNELMLINNVMWGSVTTYYTNHYNNILVNGTYNIGTGDASYNNLCDGIQYPDEHNNQQNVDMTAVFIDHDLYIDKGYFLAPGSPAAGAAMDGTDCGAFGTDPYILSGMPEIPALFEATIVPYGTTSVTVNIKATSHN